MDAQAGKSSNDFIAPFFPNFSSADTFYLPTVQVQIGQPLASKVAQVEPQLVGNSGQPLLFIDA